jgi:hypothetical protein
MDSSYNKVGSIDSTSRLPSSNPLLKSCKTYGFAIAIIIGIGGLAVGGVGAAGYFGGAISNLNQVHAIIMMAAGGGGGTVLFIVGVVGTVKNCKTGSGSVTHSSRGNRGLGISSGRQTKFIERTGSGTIRDAQRFGKTQWATYFGDVGEEPALPENIDEILNSPCPFSGDESIKVKDTHMLVLVPATVNGEALTLNKLRNLIQKPENEGHATDYDYYNSWVEDEHGGTQVEQSHWVLMTRDVVPGSRNKTYQEQKDLVNQYEGYGLPGSLEAAVCILMEHVSSGSKLFGERPLTYTRCTETVRGQCPVVVGGFNPDGLIVGNYGSGSDRAHYGVAALRKF